jgi:hypothetical protein
LRKKLGKNHGGFRRTNITTIMKWLKENLAKIIAISIFVGLFILVYLIGRFYPELGKNGAGLLEFIFACVLIWFVVDIIINSSKKI